MIRFILAHAVARQRAVEAILKAPEGWHVIVREPMRTLDANARFHATCRGLERSGLEWGGAARSLEDWKALLVSGHAIATDTPAVIVAGLEDELVNLRESTAKMSRERSRSLIAYAEAFCDLHDVARSVA